MLKKFTKSPFKIAALALAAVVLIIGGITYAQHRSRIKNPVIPSNNPLTAQQKSMAASNTSSNASQEQPKADANSSAANTGPAPATPYGDFVSNHHPGGNASTAEASTCNTSPGAVCYIEFKKGSVTKKLDAETADARGAAIWYWDVKSAGLDSGSWTVSAVAILNGQTKTASDSLALVVQ